MKALRAQSLAEIRMTLQRRETLLLTVGIPLLLLVFYSKFKVMPVPGRPVDFVTPGILALCVMSTAFVSLSIATGFDRSYGVLRRLHVTPLGRQRLILSKVIGVLVVEVLQIFLVSLVALGLGWRPRGGALGALVVLLALLLATSAFAGIGLVLAGRLKGEVNLAASNGLYLVLLFVSGFISPPSNLPGFLTQLVTAVPSGALASGMHHVLGEGRGFGVANAVSLVIWSVAGPLVAARSFQFD